jgi:hypothetical protein
MKRLFGTILTIALAAIFSGMAFEQQKAHTLKYFNVGPLAAVNFGIFCLNAVQQNAQNYKSLETTREVSQNPEQLKLLVNSYKKSPQKLQSMKRKICASLGLDATAIHVKKHCTMHGVCTYTPYKTIIIDKQFLAEPQQQQLGVLAHEAAHIIHDDCTGQLIFDTAATYATSMACYCATFMFHMQPDKETEQMIARYPKAAFSRAVEFRADKDAALVPGAAQGLIDYFKKDLAHDAQYSALNTHPTFQERIERLQPYVQ